MVRRLSPSRGAPHQQHARPPDARDEPLLRPRSAPTRLARGLSVALPSLGVAVELCTLASGDGAGEPGLAMPRRTAQPKPLPRLLAAKPVDLRIAWGIPMPTPPRTVTVSIFSLSCLWSARMRRITPSDSSAVPGTGCFPSGCHGLGTRTDDRPGIRRAVSGSQVHGT